LLLYDFSVMYLPKWVGSQHRISELGFAAVRSNP
jgi:hypothetical protein